MKRREIEIQKDPATVLPSLEEAFEKKDEPVVSLDELSTAVSDQSLKYVSTLGIRSATLARAGKFAAAHRDADLMTTIAPSLAQSYLCKGNIYAMEGRQAAAIRVYEKGLIKAAADTDPYYATLKRAMQTAKTRHSTRVDFIGTLPEEILPKIFSDMFIGDILNFIQVSKKWRERITQCPDPWRHVLLFESLHGFFSALPLAGKHIQSIQCEYLYRRQSMVLLKRMMYGQLSSLQKLNLRYGKCKADHEYDSIKDKGDFLLGRLIYGQRWYFPSGTAFRSLMECAKHIDRTDDRLRQRLCPSTGERSPRMPKSFTFILHCNPMHPAGSC